MTCKEEGCTRKVHAKNICTTHYQAMVRANKENICTVKYCGQASTAFGMCYKHYKQDYVDLKTNPVEIEKFWQFVKKELAL